MEKQDIQNLIQELIEKTQVKPDNITITQDEGDNIWFSIEITEPHSFLGRDGEALYALNHLIRRIIDNRTPHEGGAEGPTREDTEKSKSIPSLGSRVLIDINGFQKKRIDNIRTIAHMMSERARYFKSNIEVDPMTAFERRVVHEFLSNATDLETESVGTGGARRVVIKYIGEDK